MQDTGDVCDEGNSKRWVGGPLVQMLITEWLGMCFDAKEAEVPSQKAGEGQDRVEGGVLLSIFSSLICVQIRSVYANYTLMGARMLLGFYKVIVQYLMFLL